jgi:hypothetical protein
METVKMTVKPNDIVIITGDLDVYDAQEAIVQASKQFPDNLVVFLPEGATLRSMGKENALAFLDTMRKVVEAEEE